MQLCLYRKDYVNHNYCEGGREKKERTKSIKISLHLLPNTVVLKRQIIHRRFFQKIFGFRHFFLTWKFFPGKGGASPQANISSSLDSLLVCLVVDWRFLPFSFYAIIFRCFSVYGLVGSTPGVNLLSDDKQTYLPHFL